MNTIPQPLPNLAFRTFRGKNDYPIITQIITACKEADGLQWAVTLEETTRNYAHLHNSDPYRDMLFAEINNQTVGYTRVWWDVNGDNEWIGFTTGWVIPAWRSKGIGRNLLDFVETRLSELAVEQIKSGQLSTEAPRFLDNDASDSESAKIALLQHTGYQPIRYELDMMRPDLENIPELPLPEGLEVRPVLPEHYRQVWDASNEAFRDHWGYIPEPEEEFQKHLDSPDFDPSLWRVAWEGDQIAGMVLSFINQAENEEYNRNRGYTENICVRRPWRKRGLAKALIALSLKALKERGLEHAALGVDSQNISGATRLYENMGYRTVNRRTIFRKGMK